MRCLLVLAVLCVMAALVAADQSRLPPLPSVNLGSPMPGAKIDTTVELKPAEAGSAPVDAVPDSEVEAAALKILGSTAYHELNGKLAPGGDAPQPAGAALKDANIDDLLEDAKELLNGKPAAADKEASTPLPEVEGEEAGDAEEDREAGLLSKADEVLAKTKQQQAGDDEAALLELGAEAQGAMGETESRDWRAAEAIVRKHKLAPAFEVLRRRAAAARGGKQ